MPYETGAVLIAKWVDFAYEVDESGRIVLTYEDEELVATLKMLPEAIPKNAVFEVTEIKPNTAENADIYAETLTILSDTLKQDGKSVSSPVVYDLRITDVEGNVIEPEGDVSVDISYKKEKNIGEPEDGDAVQVAHLKEDSDNYQVEILDSSANITEDGTLADAAFTTDSFSIYVLYNGTNVRSKDSYIPIGSDDIGWIKFVDPGTGNGGVVTGTKEASFPLGTEDGYKRAVQVKFYKLNSGADPEDAEGNIITDNYTEITVPESYFWTWQNSFTIEDYEFKEQINSNNNTRTTYDLIGTRFKTAWAELNMPEEHVEEVDSLIGSYAVRGIQSSDQTTYSLNTLDVYLQETTMPWNQDTDLRYIVEYVHADGSKSEGQVHRMGAGDSVTISAADYVRNGEKYAGITVGTGYEAVSVDKSTGTATISYNASVPLVKVTVYYQIAEDKNAEAVTPYDKSDNNDKYDNSRSGLHTDKKVTKVSDRDYELTFETWNIIQNAADVAMILDASGSMAWAAGNDATGDLAPITVDQSKLSKTYNTYSNPNTNGKLGYYNGNSPAYLSDTDVNRILNTHYTDNSKLNYSGYSYYVYCAYSDIKEYVALGYNTSTKKSQSIAAIDNILGQNYNGAGWYFVDTTGNPSYLRGTQYSNKDYVGIAPTNSSGWYSPFYNPYNQFTTNDPIRPKFYVGSDGYLHCVYYKNNYQTNNGANGATGTASFLWDSIVYEKTSTSMTKTEVLQDSIARFTTILKGQMEGSKVAMTRFSHADFSNSLGNLVLLKWTSSTENIIGAMNNVNTTNGAAISNGQYNFTLTGGTVTKNGVQSYIQNIKNTLSGSDASDKNNKYIIIFTDGKDTANDATASNGGETGKLVRTNTDSLVNQGYTVFTVLMRSKAMDDTQALTDAQGFLKYLATGNRNSDTENGVKKYFEAAADDPTGMVEAFRQIALSITSLEGYTIQDYVDPRFNVLNSAGEILSVLDENGKFTNGRTGSDRIDWSSTGRQFTTQDGKSATLYYDNTKQMFYIQWTDQRIYSNAIGEEVVHPWGSTVRLQAKEDFIGGNDIVTNGDEENQNRVFHPDFPNNSSKDAKHPAKDFPRTAVNVALLKLDSGHYEDTVFLGETIKPTELLTYLEGTVDRNEYIEFLSRAGAKDKNNVNYYLDQLASGKQVVVDYRYLGSSNSRIYAGIDQQNDVIGKLIYTWEPVDDQGNKRNPIGNEDPGWKNGSGFTVDEARDYRYKLVIQYVPAVQDSDTSVTLPDGNSDTLKSRISELGKYVPSNNVVFPDANELTKQPQGNTVSEKLTTSNAVIHVVDGRIHLEKKVDKEAMVAYLDGLGGSDTLQFDFHLKKDQTADYRKISLILSKSGTASDVSAIDTDSSSITITLTKDSVSALDADADGMVDIVSMWLTSLPKGDYTLTETIAGGDYLLESMEVVSDYYEHDYPTSADLAKFLAQSTPVVGNTSSSVTWYMGKTPLNTTQQFADCVDGTTLFPVRKVTDAYKEVDPRLSVNNGKVYLNARVGEVVIKNKLLSGEFTIDKLDESNQSFALDGVEFTLYKAVVQGNVWTKGDQFGDVKTTSKKPGESHAYAKFSALDLGTYLLYETKTRDGYILPTDPWKVTVSKNQSNEIVVTITDNDGNAITMDDGIITLTNVAGYELPSTGGPGIRLFTVLGGIVVMLSGVSLIQWRRRRAA